MLHGRIYGDLRDFIWQLAGRHREFPSYFRSCSRFNTGIL